MIIGKQDKHWKLLTSQYLIQWSVEWGRCRGEPLSSCQWWRVVSSNDCVMEWEWTARPHRIYLASDKIMQPGGGYTRSAVSGRPSFSLGYLRPNTLGPGVNHYILILKGGGVVVEDSFFFREVVDENYYYLFNFGLVCKQKVGAI
jgi:hypothetical protein